MKVITLERIKDFVSDRHGEQVVSKINIKGCDKKSGVIVIHDAGTENLKAFINSRKISQCTIKHSSFFEYQ